MKRAIVTGGTKSDVAPMAVFVINIKETNSDLFDEVVIFHDGISKKDQKLINDIFPTRFIEYVYPNKSRNDEVLSYFSYMLFCKYECFALLKEYDEVVWSDYDVVVLGSLEQMCNVKDGFINVLSCDNRLKTMFYKEIKNKAILEYDLEGDGIPTPIFTVSRGLKDYEKIHKWCYEKTGEWDEDLYYPEQCIVSLAIQEFNVQCERFPFEIYACYPTKAKGDELIIHAAGQPKFWNGLNNDKWNEMYAAWRKSGGSAYQDWKKVLLRKWLLIKTRLMGVRDKEHD